MHASAIDFVTALSAEERCARCHELHAAVDQRRCGACDIAVCADCARSLAHASWICTSCAPPVFTSTQLRIGSSFAGWFERTLSWRRAVAVRLSARTTWRRLRFVVVRLWARDAAQVRRLAGRVGVAAREASRRAAVVLHWHMTGWLLGSAILIAVSRAEHPRDHR